VSDTEGPTTEEVLVANQAKNQISNKISGYERWSYVVPYLEITNILLTSSAVTVAVEASGSKP